MDIYSKIPLQSSDYEALNHIPSGVGIYDVEGDTIKLRYINDGYFQMLDYEGRPVGYDEATMKQEYVLGKIHVDDREKVLQEIHRSIAENRAFDLSLRILNGQGSYFWVGMCANHEMKKPGIYRFYAVYYNVDEYINAKLLIEAQTRDLKAAEQMKEEVRKMYEAAIEEANLIVCEYDIVHHRVNMAENKFIENDYRKFGIPKVIENAPESLLIYIDDAYVDVFLEMYRQIEAGEPQASCEVWYKIQQGMEPRCDRLAFTTIYDANHRPVKAYGIGQNITQQKLAELEYNRLQNQFTSNLQDIVSSNHLNLSQNQYISGYSPFLWLEHALEQNTADEHFVQAAQTIGDEQVKQEILKKFNCKRFITLFQNGEQQLEKIYPARATSGGIRWIQATFHMMQNPETGDVEMINYAKDITEEKRTHEIIDCLSSTGCDYIGVIDVYDNLLIMHTGNWNRLKESEHQRIDYDEVREIIKNYIAPDQREEFMQKSSLSFLKQSLQDKAHYILTYEYFYKNDTKILLKKQIMFSWLNKEKREILCIQQDMTEAYHKEQEQIIALEAAKKEADRANEAKSVFLSSMSHDMRTPLNGVLGFTALALKEENPEKIQDYLRKTDTSGKLLRDLITDTLELSRIEGGKITLEMEIVMPMNLIPAVITSLRPSAELKQIQLQTKLNIDTETPVWCDKLKVQKIALNLISNAIKFTPAGGIVQVCLSQSSRTSHQYEYCLTITDTGIGMSEAFVSKMYESFSQEKRSWDVNEPGTGLGLSIVKQYIDLMGGTIEASSVLNQGTEIIVHIPIKRSKEALIKEQDNEKENQLLQGKKILLCEDNDMNTEIALMLLQDKKMLVETAPNGKIGLDKFIHSKEYEFDAILMDLRMPVMNGYEAARCIRSLERKDARTIPVIAMSADVFEESIQEAKLIGMNAYLTKPIEPSQLFQTLLTSFDAR